MASVAVDVLLGGVRDLSGNPLTAGLVYTYQPGTTTPRAVYTDSGLITPAANPVVLDAYGMATVYANTDYKFVVKTAAGATLYTWDNLNFLAPGSDAFPNGGNAGGANRTQGNTDNYSLGLLTNNTNRLHITNAGDVGLGTTSPAFQLHIVDNSASLAGIRVDSSENNIATAVDLYSNGSNAAYRNWRMSANATASQLDFFQSATASSAPTVALFSVNATSAIIPDGAVATPALTFKSDVNSGMYLVGADKIGVATGGVQRMVVDDAGNVGIGVASPGVFCKLAVNGNVMSADNGQIGWLTAQGSPTDYISGNQASHYVRLYTNNVERIRVDTSGNVGINTAAPAYKLEVAGTGAVNGTGLALTGTLTGSHRMLVVNTSGELMLGTEGSSAGNLATGSLAYASILGSNTAVATQIISNNTARVTILSDGKVGIGTATPTSKLSIVGLPTSSAGLAAGDIWANSGVLTVV